MSEIISQFINCGFSLFSWYTKTYIKIDEIIKYLRQSNKEYVLITTLYYHGLD